MIRGESGTGSTTQPTPTPTATPPGSSNGSQRGIGSKPAAGTSASDPLSNPTVPGGATTNVPAYLRYPVTYRPPAYGTADRQEQQISAMPLVYRAQTSGDLREAYWSDPGSRAIIQAAARVYYRDYPNFNDQWAEGLWQKDILGASLNPGSPPAWQALQMIFSGQVTASSDPDGSSSSSSYGGGGGGYSGGGSGGGGGQVSLTNPASARGLLMQTMQSVLGRDPTGNEVKTFLATLNETEMANPQTVSVEGDTVVGKGGTDPGLLAMEFAQDATDYKERQGDMYYQTFMRALAGGV